MVSEESVVITAPSVEEAIILGLTRLTATREEVDIEVLDEGNRGFLGLGSREAKVRVTRRPAGARPEPSAPELAAPPPAQAVPAQPAAPDKAASSAVAPVEAAPAEVAPAEAAPAKAVPEEVTAPHPPVSESDVRPAAQPAKPAPAAAELTPPAPERSAPERVDDGLDRDRLTAIAVAVSENLTPGLDIEAAVTWLDEDRPTMWISLEGRDASSLVGPRARNLHAIQYLFRALIYHQLDGEYNIVVDADGYRRRRRRSLESMAAKKADQAIKTGKTVRLRSMPAHERRIIHIVLRKDDRVTTESVGKGRDRAVTIIPKRSRS